MKPLDVIYYPGKPSKGRAKAKPPRWTISERGSYVSLMEITPGISSREPAELFAILDIMARDFSGLRLRDNTVETTAEAIRESLARLDS